MFLAAARVLQRDREKSHERSDSSYHAGNSPGSTSMKKKKAAARPITEESTEQDAALKGLSVSQIK